MELGVDKTSLAKVCKTYLLRGIDIHILSTKAVCCQEERLTRINVIINLGELI